MRSKWLYGVLGALLLMPGLAYAVSFWGGGGGSLTVAEGDASPSVSGVTSITVPNGSLTDNGSGSVTFTPAGTGDVVGPASSTDNAIVRFDLTTGKLLQNSGCTISDANLLTCSGGFAAGSGSVGIVEMLEGTAPGAHATTSWHNCYIDSKTSHFACHENGGSAKDYVTTADTQTLTNKPYDAEGTGNVLTIARRLWFPAAGCNNATAGSIWDLPTSNPAVAACVTGTNTQKGVLDFADGANTLSAQITYKLPSTWTGTVDANIKWFSATTTGSVVWQLATICVADAETDDPAFNTASTVTDAAKGTTNQTNDAAITTVTVTGCAAGELMHIKILRDPTNGSDDHAATARLIGVELVIREAI